MWTFLNPLFLWGAAAALIPLVLHLLRQRRIVRMRFSSVRLLRLVQKKSSRRIRMENLLLWLLRTALLLVLALAFALPVWRSEAAGRWLGASHRDVAVVLDASYSMRYASGQRNVWEEAQAAAATVIEGLGKGDRVCLFLAGDDTTPVLAQPSGDLELAMTAIRGQQAGTGSSRIRPALLAALTALADSGYREREVHVFTDGQALPWQDFLQATNETPDRTALAGEDITFFVTLLGAPTPQNTAPIEVEMVPPLLRAGAPSRLLVRVAHRGPPRTGAVSLLINGREVSRAPAAFDEDRVTEATLPVPPLEPGAYAAEVRTPPDALETDDTLYLVLRPRARLEAVCIGSASDAFFLLKALNPAEDAPGAIQVRRIEPGAVTAAELRGAACVFCCNAVPLSGQAVLALEDYVRDGGVLALFPGDRAAPADYDMWSCLPAKPAAIRDVAAANRSRTIRLLKTDSPFFASLRLPPGTAPVVQMRRAIQWGPPAPEAVPLLASGADDVFLWQRSFGRGQTLFFGTTADRSWGSFPLSPMFVPILHQIVLTGAGLGREPLHVVLRDGLALRDLVPPELAEHLAWRGPDGQDVAPQLLREEDRTTWRFDELRAPGVYWAARGEERAPGFALNLDRREADVRPVAATELPKWTGLRRLHVAMDRDELLRKIEEHRRGRPMTEALLWLALVLATAEVILANRMGRKTALLTEQMPRLLSGRVRSRATA